MFKAEFIFLKRNCPRWRPAGKCYESGPLFKWRNQACIQIAECLSSKFRSFDQQLAHYSPVDQFKFKRPWIYRLKQTCQFEPFKKKNSKIRFNIFVTIFWGGRKSFRSEPSENWTDRCESCSQEGDDDEKRSETDDNKWSTSTVVLTLHWRPNCRTASHCTQILLAFFFCFLSPVTIWFQPCHCKISFTSNVNWLNLSSTWTALSKVDVFLNEKCLEIKSKLFGYTVGNFPHKLGSLESQPKHTGRLLIKKQKSRTRNHKVSAVKLLISSNFNLEIINRFPFPCERRWGKILATFIGHLEPNIYELKGSFSGNAAILQSGNENMWTHLLGAPHAGPQANR